MVLSTDSLIPTFGSIFDILLVDVDLPLFVCEILEVEGFVEHYHAYTVVKQKPTPLTICRQSVLSILYLNIIYYDSLYQKNIAIRSVLDTLFSVACTHLETH